MIRRLCVALAALLTVGFVLAPPASAVRSGSNHLDGKGYWALVGGGSGYDQHCDDWGGNFNGTPYDQACSAGVLEANNGGSEPSLSTSSADSNMVGAVQWILWADGYLFFCPSTGGGIDGIYGSNTASAVSAWNNAHGLGTSSTWGNQSWKKAAKNLRTVFSGGVIYDGGTASPFSFYFLHTTNGSVASDYIVWGAFDETHGTNYDGLDANFGPDC